MLYNNVFLLLGSNLDDRLANLNQALKLIKDQVGQIIKYSSVYETSAWGKTDQPDFLNQAVQIQTNLQPAALLSSCLGIERIMGRQRVEKWGSRTIDIDIIYFDNTIIETYELTIPHPRLTERKFVLIPITEISPNFIHPVLNKTNSQLLEVCSDSLSVSKL